MSCSAPYFARAGRAGPDAKATAGPLPRTPHALAERSMAAGGGRADRSGGTRAGRQRRAHGDRLSAKARGGRPTEVSLLPLVGAPDRQRCD